MIIKNNKKCVGLPADIAADTAHFQAHPKSNRFYGGGSKPIFIPSITSYKPINFSGIFTSRLTSYFEVHVRYCLVYHMQTVYLQSLVMNPLLRFKAGPRFCKKRPHVDDEQWKTQRNMSTWKPLNQHLVRVLAWYINHKFKRLSDSPLGLGIMWLLTIINHPIWEW